MTYLVTRFTSIIDEIIEMSKSLMDVSLKIWEYLNLPVATPLIRVVFADVSVPTWVDVTAGFLQNTITMFLSAPYVLITSETPSYLQLILFYAPLIIVGPIVNWIWGLIKSLF